MTTLHEAAQQALEALELAVMNGEHGLYRDELRQMQESIEDLRSVLAQQGEPCDMGQMCLNCQPRWPNDECPDKAAPAAQQGEQQEPDWSLLEATQESLREHMAMVKELQAKLAQQESLEFESALYELVDKICPGLDTGDLLDDARTASSELSKRTPGWTDADADAARLALELECLLLETEDTAKVSKWWSSGMEALELHRQRLAAAPAPHPDTRTVVQQMVEALKYYADEPDDLGYDALAAGQKLLKELK